MKADADPNLIVYFGGQYVPLKEARVGILTHALHYGTEDLNAGKHAFELPRRETVTLNLDLVQQGVGGDDSWGAWPHEPFMIPCKEQSYSFRLCPFDRSQSPEKLARTVLPKL